MKSNWLVVAGTVVTALLPGRVEAHSGVIRFAASGAGNFTLEGDLGPGAPPIINIPLPAPMSATAKRDYVVQYVASVPGIQMVPLESDRCICRFLIPHATIRVRNGDTASINTAIAARASAGKIGFTGLFDPFDANHQPAVFTAGIVTDVGTLTESVTAGELNFQTDGPIICQALFQRLAPRAPQYGAQINYAGDRLEVYFDPAYSLNPSGTQGGTTSRTPGSYEEVQGPAADAPPNQLTLSYFDGQAGVVGTRIAGGACPAPIVATPILAPQLAPAIRNSVLNSLLAGGANATTLGPASLRIDGLQPQPELVLATPGTTGSTQEIRKSLPQGGRVTFADHFEPMVQTTQPAVFTAGIVTDVGELSVNVTAAELNFQTDGPIICQALFQRLAPRAPQYGAQINYAGDRLEVYFDPAYTVTQGGIIFGTTSPSPGAFGTIDPLPLGTPGSGDGNGDGKLNGLDVRPCVLRSANAPLFKSTFPLVDPHDMDLTGDGLFDPSDGAALAWKLTHATCP